MLQLVRLASQRESPGFEYWLGFLMQEICINVEFLQEIWFLNTVLKQYLLGYWRFYIEFRYDCDGPTTCLTMLHKITDAWIDGWVYG